MLLGQRARQPHEGHRLRVRHAPIGEGAPRLSVKFYLVAMLFILFDIEVVFMYPWAVVYKDMLKDARRAI